MLLERIKAHSAALGDRPALTAGEKVIRWGELWPMAQGLAAKLREQGTGPVALVGDPAEVWVPVAFVACLLAGRPYLPLDPLLPPAGQRELLEQAGAAAEESALPPVSGRRRRRAFHPDCPARRPTTLTASPIRSLPRAAPAGPRRWR